MLRVGDMFDCMHGECRRLEMCKARRKCCAANTCATCNDDLVEVPNLFNQTVTAGATDWLIFGRRYACPSCDRSECCKCGKLIDLLALHCLYGGTVLCGPCRYPAAR